MSNSQHIFYCTFVTIKLSPPFSPRITDIPQSPWITAAIVSSGGNSLSESQLDKQRRSFDRDYGESNIPNEVKHVITQWRARPASIPFREVIREHYVSPCRPTAVSPVLLMFVAVKSIPANDGARDDVCKRVTRGHSANYVIGDLNTFALSPHDSRLSTRRRIVQVAFRPSRDTKLSIALVSRVAAINLPILSSTMLQVASSFGGLYYINNRAV